MDTEFGTSRKRGAPTTEALRLFQAPASTFLRASGHSVRTLSSAVNQDRVLIGTLRRTSSKQIKAQITKDGGRLTAETALKAWEHACYSMHVRSNGLFNRFGDVDFTSLFYKASGIELGPDVLEKLMSGVKTRSEAKRLFDANHALTLAKNLQADMERSAWGSRVARMQLWARGTHDPLQLRFLISFNQGLLDHYERNNLGLPLRTGAGVLADALFKIAHRQVSYVEYRRLNDNIKRARNLSAQQYADKQAARDRGEHVSDGLFSTEPTERAEAVARVRTLQEQLHQDLSSIPLSDEARRSYLIGMSRVIGVGLDGHGPGIPDSSQSDGGSDFVFARRSAAGYREFDDETWRAAIAGLSAHYGLTTDVDPQVPFTPTSDSDATDAKGSRHKEGHGPTKFEKPPTPWDILGVPEGDFKAANLAAKQLRRDYVKSNPSLERETDPAAWERFNDVNRARAELARLKTEIDTYDARVNASKQDRQTRNPYAEDTPQPNATSPYIPADDLFVPSDSTTPSNCAPAPDDIRHDSPTRDGDSFAADPLAHPLFAPGLGNSPEVDHSQRQAARTPTPGVEPTDPTAPDVEHHNLQNETAPSANSEPPITAAPDSETPRAAPQTLDELFKQWDGTNKTADPSGSGPITAEPNPGTALPPRDPRGGMEL